MKENILQIYLVITQDREPVAAFSEEEFSDIFIRLYSGESFQKETMLLDAARRYDPPKDKDVYRVRINRDGDIIEAEKVERTFFNVSVIGMMNYDANSDMVINMWAKDYIDAKHMVNNLRSMVMDKNEWVLIKI